MLRDENITAIPENYARTLRHQGFLPGGGDVDFSNERFLFLESRLTPVPDKGLLNKVHSTLLRKARQIVERFQNRHSPERAHLRDVWNAALQRIEDKNYYDVSKSPNHYFFTQRHSTLHHIILLYVMRPNRHFEQASDRVVEQTLSGRASRPMIGFPIRGSDKCLRESTCLSFDTYMDLGADVLKRQFGASKRKSKATILISTEDPTIHEIASNQTNKYPFRILLNQNDSLQGSGRPSDFGGRGDEVMLSSLTALKLQLSSDFVVTNCCSNFHTLLMDLLFIGCGRRVTTGRKKRLHGGMCIQEHTNPRYRICCQWSQSEQCSSIKSNATGGLFDNFYNSLFSASS